MSDLSDEWEELEDRAEYYYANNASEAEPIDQVENMEREEDAAERRQERADELRKAMREDGENV